VSAASERAFDMRSAALMELKNSTLLKFMNEQMIPKPKQRNKAAYASAIVDHMNRMELGIELNPMSGILAISVTSWHK